jgi:hypothetical protein
LKESTQRTGIPVSVDAPSPSAEEGHSSARCLRRSGAEASTSVTELIAALSGGNCLMV